MNVPFLDLKAQYATIRDEINIAIQKVLDSCAFAGGPFVKKFEEDFSEYCGCKYAVGVSSGTSALWSALLALGIGEGDEVITTPNSFIATAEAISFCGATPVFIDIDDEYYTMNPELLEKLITKKTKAIIPVHLFGQMADMDAIMEIANKYSLYVIEDACQAHGADVNGHRAGSIGNIGCFSFYPGKNLGAYGEGGAIVTNDDEVYKKVCMFRDHGQPTKYNHEFIGWNARLDGIQGAVLSVKLKYLDSWNDKRIKNATAYNEMLAELKGIITPKVRNGCKHVYHIYAIRVESRDEVVEILKSKNISSGIHYPIPIHLQTAYKELKLREGNYPVTENTAGHMISLPMFSEMAQEQIQYVVEGLREAL